MQRWYHCLSVSMSSHCFRLLHPSFYPFHWWWSQGWGGWGSCPRASWLVFAGSGVHQIATQTMCSPAASVMPVVHLYFMLRGIFQKADADIVVHSTIIEAFGIAKRITESKDDLGKVLLEGVRSTQRCRTSGRRGSPCHLGSRVVGRESALECLCG